MAEFPERICEAEGGVMLFSALCCFSLAACGLPQPPTALTAAYRPESETQQEPERPLGQGAQQHGSLGRPPVPQDDQGWPPRKTRLLLLTVDQQIACGSEHNLAIVGGRLLSWGWNEHGMCGDGTEVNVGQPQPIPALQGAGPLLIGCGAGHSMALCERRGSSSWETLSGLEENPSGMCH
ncbi:SRGEF factor, partial [Atractosteus spatula]|nr:SRGEF factor [Atractosteus spatula]